MPAVEGARRLKRLGQCIVGSGIMGACAALVIIAFAANRGDSLWFYVNVAPFLAMVGGCVWALGWVLEGFLSK